MALVQCSECGNTVSNQSDSCPKCGKPMRRRGMMAGLLSGSSGVVMLVIFVIVLIALKLGWKHVMRLRDEVNQDITRTIGGN